MIVNFDQLIIIFSIVVFIVSYVVLDIQVNTTHLLPMVIECYLSFVPTPSVLVRFVKLQLTLLKQKVSLVQFLLTNRNNSNFIFFE